MGCQSSPPAETANMGVVDPSMNGKIDQIVIPEGFVIEHLYSPSENEQGSWVSITKTIKVV